MQQAPGVGEFGISLATEQVSHVDVEVAGPGKRSSVAQQAESFAIGDDSPLVLRARVQQFLRELKRRLFTGAAVPANAMAIGVPDTKARISFVQTLRVRSNDDG